MSLHFSQFEDIGKLPNLRHVSLVHLKSVEKALQLLLQWECGYKKSAFQFLQKLTSLELGAHRHAPVNHKEYQGLSHLTDLQHLTLQRRPFPVPTSGYTPYSILKQLSALTSLEVDELGLGIYWMTRLQSLSILPGRHMELKSLEFASTFLSLQGLTALGIGPNPARQNRNDPVMVLRDLLSFRVFSSIQKLTLRGMVGLPAGDHTPQTALWSPWEGLATFTSVKHLEAEGIHHTEDAFTTLAKMTQLTCLDLAFKSQHVQVDTFDEQLAALSTLTNLDKLRCLFSCRPRQVVWSLQDQKYLAGPCPLLALP